MGKRSLLFRKDAIRELSVVLYFLCLNILSKMEMKGEKQCMPGGGGGGGYVYSTFSWLLM